MNTYFINQDKRFFWNSRYEDEIGCAMEDTPEINDCQYAIEETNAGRFTVSAGNLLTKCILTPPWKFDSI